VTNPLLGQRGAAQVFAPQKGASLTDVALLEVSLARFAEVAGGAQINSPGAGAAGGMGFMAFTFLGAAQRSGIEIVIELSGLKESLAHVDLVITGEGKFDSQSLGGKAPLGILTIASDKGIPVFLVCGQAELTGNHGFSKIYSLNSLEADIEKCISHPAPLLIQTGVLIASEL
jgi:glycerate kinase